MNPLFSQLAGWWLGTAIAGGALLLGVAFAMSWVKQPAARQRLGEWGIVAALLIAVLRLGPSWLPLPWPVPAQETAALNKYADARFMLVKAEPESEMAGVAHGLPLIPANMEPGPTVEKTPWLLWSAMAALAIYFVTASVMMVRWFVGQWALNRLLRDARPAPMFIQQIVRDISPNSKAELLISTKVGVPMCCGLLRSKIVLPESLVKSPDIAALQWVLVHELTHLNRRDPWSLWALGIGQAVYFFLPWFWWVRRQVRLCQEYVADAAAASMGRWADEYAQFLVRLAQSPAAPLGATGVRGRTSDLYRRVSMLLESSKGVQGRCSKRWALAAGAGVLSAAVVLSGIGFAGDPPKKDNGPEDVLIWNDADGEDIIFRWVGDEKVEGKDGVVIIRAQAALQGDKDGQKDKKVERKIVINGKELGGDFDMKEIEKEIRKALKGVEEKKADEVVAKLKEAMSKIQLKMDFDVELPKAEMEKAHAAMKALKIDHAELHKKMMEAMKNAKIDVEVGGEELQKKVQEAMKGAQWQAALPQIIELKEGMIPGMAQGGHGNMLFHAAAVGTGRLGVMIEVPSATLADQLDLPKDTGVVIKAIVPGSAAEKAGFKGNDILLSIDGKTVPASNAGLVKIVESIKSGEEVKAIVLRKGRKEGIAVKLAEVKESKEGAMRFRVIEANEDGKPGDGDVKVFRKIIGDPGKDHAEIIAKVIAEKDAKAAKDAKGDKSEQKDKKSVNRTISINEGQFTAKEQDGDVTISVTGKMEDGKLSVKSVTIDEPGAKSSFSDLDKVPEKYRGRVKKLIATQGGGEMRFEFKGGK